MAKIKTPLLRPLRKNGSTLYTFPSASEDIALNLNSGTQGVAMSHYALLNLTKNNFNFSSTDQIILSLQNWMMNSETVLLNQPTYNFQESKTVSERVFWNWINTHSKTANSIFTDSPVIGNIYREKNYKSTDKDRLVQCFGMIDSGNHLSTDFGMFSETYVNIPTSYGNGPVFFESVKDDSNYSKNIKYTVGSIIQGRTTTDLTYIQSSNSLKPEIDTYTDSRAFEIVKDLQTISKACQTFPNASKNIKLNSFDDVNIDSDNQFDSISGLNINSIECEFKFNAVLLYYSIYDLNDVNKEPVATNLFGIVFLDGGAYSEDSTYMLHPTVKKKSFKSQNSGTSYFGSGYSFRINIKTMSVYDNTDASIEDNTTTTSLYSQDFNDVIATLNKAVDIMNTNMHTTSAIQNKYMEMCTQYVEIRNQLKVMEDNLVNELEDRMNHVLADFTERYETAIIDLKAELGITDEDITDSGVETESVYGSSQNNTPLLLQPILRHLYPQLKESITNRFGAAYVDNNAVENTGVISNKKIDVLSATDANINAKHNVNITASDINFNFKTDEEHISQVPVSGLIHRINDIENNMATSSANMTNFLMNMGIIIISGILAPKSKKPQHSGFYLKENSSGNITQYVFFDGENYKDTVKCEKGKIYSVNGKNYAFNGETCKVIE